MTKEEIALKIEDLYKELKIIHAALTKINEGDPQDGQSKANLRIVNTMVSGVDEIITGTKEKICTNCGKPFVPLYRSDTLFCDAISPQDRNKTCKEYGWYMNYLEKTRNDTATKLYKQIYNRKAAKIKRREKANKSDAVLVENLKDFMDKAKQLKVLVKAAEIEEMEYINWLIAEKTMC